MPGRILDAVTTHCRHSHPVEACGILAGPVGGDPDEVIPMTNTHKSSVRYGFDPQEQLTVWQQLADAGRAPLVIYHSHTNSGSTMSRTDIESAAEPGAHYLIVSTAPDASAVRAWRVVDGAAVESPIEVVP
ncbi:MAG TPA: M67 family metallopeptidase [Pseudonocardiaceae bacterium]|nr:M67 family metallopeptidase [Pseudonocardiaceae bacterium]